MVEGLVDDRGPILGVHALGECRRADDIGEQRGHGLALAGELRLAHLLDERRRGGRREATASSASAGSAGVIALPQFEQKRASAGTDASQRGQEGAEVSIIFGPDIVAPNIALAAHVTVCRKV